MIGQILIPTGGFTVGQATLETTMNIYVKVTHQSKKKEIDVLEECIKTASD